VPQQTFVHTIFGPAGQDIGRLDLAAVRARLKEGWWAVRETSLGDYGVLFVMEKEGP
jgi:hypothetical protein